MSKYFEKFKQKCFSIIGEECCVCKSKENLEMDHILPKFKSFSISTCWSSKTWSEIVNELQKCRTLCHDCHQKKSSLENAERLQKDRSLLHGTESQYSRYKCRCDICKKAHNSWRKEHRLKTGETKGVRIKYKKAICGSNSMYRNGCRCTLCKTAHNDKARDYNCRKVI